jgi:hypothetical protein
VREKRWGPGGADPYMAKHGKAPHVFGVVE